MKKLSHRSSHQRIVIKLSVRKDWRCIFLRQFYEAIDKGKILGYPKVLYPEPALVKVWRRRD